MHDVLLLQDLIKFTPTSHTDYDSLQKTLGIAQKYLNTNASNGHASDGHASDGSQVCFDVSSTLTAVTT